MCHACDLKGKLLSRTFQAAARSVCLAFKQKRRVGEAQVALTSALAASQPYPSHCEHCSELQSGPCEPALLPRPVGLPVYGSLLLPMWPVLCHLAGKEDLRQMLPLVHLEGFSPLRGAACLFSMASLTTRVKSLNSIPLADFNGKRSTPGSYGKINMCLQSLLSQAG